MDRPRTASRGPGGLVRSWGPSVALLVAAAVVAAIQSGGSETDGSTAGVSRVAEAVCEAARAAPGSAVAAERRFEEVHRDLHVLADRTQDADRAAAAELLRAKRDVEEALAGAGGRLAARLERLRAAVAAALESLDQPVAPCAATAGSD